MSFPHQPSSSLPFQLLSPRPHLTFHRKGQELAPPAWPACESRAQGRASKTTPDQRDACPVPRDQLDSCVGKGTKSGRVWEAGRVCTHGWGAEIRKVLGTCWLLTQPPHRLPLTYICTYVSLLSSSPVPSPSSLSYPL